VTHVTVTGERHRRVESLTVRDVGGVATNVQHVRVESQIALSDQNSLFLTMVLEFEIWLASDQADGDSCTRLQSEEMGVIMTRLYSVSSSGTPGVPRVTLSMTKSHSELPELIKRLILEA